MLRRLEVLALAVALLAACSSDDDGPDVATIDQMRVIKVRGDQATQVPPAGGPSPSVILAAVVGADGYTDEPLVARVVAEDDAGIMGIDAAAVPPGTLVHWHLPEEAGRLYGSTTATDDTAYVINRWAPGTKAGVYTATAGRLVGGQIVTDATWTLEVLPGPISRLDFNGPTHRIHKDSALVVDLRPYVMFASDAHGNEIPVDSIRALPDDRVGWAWYDRGGADETNRPTEPTHTGWTAPLPALDEFSERCNTLQGQVHEDGSETSYAEACTKLPGIVVWIDGHLAAHPVAVVVRTSCTIFEPDKVDPHICDW